MFTRTNENHPPERIALGAATSMTGSLSRLFGRSIFKLQALNVIGASTLVVAGTEYGIGALVLLFVAYRVQIARALGFGRGKQPPNRLRFTGQVVYLMIIIGALNVLGRGFAAFALDSPGMTIAVFNAFSFAVPLLIFSFEEWRRHPVAAAAVPVLMFAGLAVTATLWESPVTPQGIAWSLAGGLCSLLYLPLSRKILVMGKEAADQFQSLITLQGALGLFVWAVVAGESLTGGWSWRLLGILVITSVLSVVIPRYLHIVSRRAVQDGFYAVLSVLSLPIAVGVDFIMERSVPGVAQVAGLCVIAALALLVARLRRRDRKAAGPPEPDAP